MATGASSCNYSGAFRVDYGASSSSAAAAGCSFGGRRTRIVDSLANCRTLWCSSSLGRRRNGGAANFLSVTSWGPGLLAHRHQLRICAAAAAASQGGDDERRSSTRTHVATSERSEATNEELLLFLFQLDLATRLQVHNLLLRNYSYRNERTSILRFLRKSSQSTLVRNINAVGPTKIHSLTLIRSLGEGLGVRARNPPLTLFSCMSLFVKPCYSFINNGFLGEYLLISRNVETASFLRKCLV
jgi:hypothetical protein